MDRFNHIGSTHFARVRGIEMAYADAGTGHAIVLLHGFPFNRSMWDPQIDFLVNNGLRVVAPDLPGFGETSWSGEIITMEELACSCAALLDELKIGQAIVCGLSMGAYVALEFAHQFPARISALVLAGARAEAADEAEKESREQQAKRALTEGMIFAVSSIQASLLAANTVSNKPDVVAHVQKMILSTNPRVAAAAQRGMSMRRDYSGDLTDIVVPTLIIAGHEDRVRKPADAELIHQGIKNSRLQIIDEAGHLMNMEQPEAFNRAIIRFVQEVV